MVQRAVGGDTRAFDWLVIKYEARVARLIGRWVRDPGLCEDVTQDTFIKAYKALPQFRGEAKFYTWLYRIAVNSAKKAVMRANKDPVRSLSSLQKDDDDETSGSAWEQTNMAVDEHTPETALASKEIALAINAAMDALPSELREAITLREIEGMSYEDIASTMACPIGTVRSRIFRAREAISARIKPMLDKQGGKRW
jgi:RNA polymerase sigma-70 factor (ECF subfamily)|tara:strand:- start:1836 stop:2426 length:591 start_codon:yes stop_codon:yes gene_type:complete